MLQVAREVVGALEAGSGVVALESTLITHGLPWPDNLAVARESEAAVRHSGAVPATIAVVRGVVRVGLTDAELAGLAAGTECRKASRRDLSFAVARGCDAATTVAATLWVARRAGIGVVATGGLGGVHRDAATSFDLSTDLDELARADGMALVCSGVKSILDIPATLEALETRGVPVIGYGTTTLPAFTAQTSGQPLDAWVETPGEAAAVVQAHRDLGLPGAVILAQPVDSRVAVPEPVMDQAIAQAIAEAHAAGVRGKAVTPFLLARVREATGGQSLVANRSLIVANAGLAGAVAAALAQRQRGV